MNRLELIREMSKHLTTEKEAKLAVIKIFELMAGELRSNKKVVISNFGTFKVLERAPRQGINPATGEAVIIEGHRAVSFRPAPLLQEVVNG